MTVENSVPGPAEQPEQNGGDGRSDRSPKIHIFLKTVNANNASDLHIKADVPPRIRIGGDLKTLKTEPMTNPQIEELVREFLTEDQWEDLNRRGNIDLAYAMSKTDRYRMNIFKQRGSISLAVRRINPKVPDYKSLNLPDVFNSIAEHEQGLIILCGITGSGKSTTIAAMLEQINDNKSVHIVTIEDPIEYTYQDKKAFINQREVGLDVDSFESAIRAMMREDPDVILIGEMRDRVTFQAAIQAAETGHLVFSTLHASSCSGAITRILELFPKEMHQNIREALAANLQAVVYQKLVPALDPKIKRVPVVEVMLSSPSIRKYILEEREAELLSVIRAEKAAGMIDFNDMLADLITREVIHYKEGYAASPNADELRMRLRGIKTA